VIADLAVEMHGFLNDIRVKHAFGGALALNCYAEPRGSIDVDVNISVPMTEADGIVAKLEVRGFAPLLNRSEWMPAGGVRVVRELDIVDLFFSFDAYHQLLLANSVEHPFPYAGGVLLLPFLSASDLVLVKLAFNRTKDWADIEAMLLAGTQIDSDYIGEHLLAFKGAGMHPRLSRLKKLFDSITPQP
jgi:hypothetical protein